MSDSPSTEPSPTVLSRRCPDCGTLYPHDEAHSCSAGAATQAMPSAQAAADGPKAVAANAAPTLETGGPSTVASSTVPTQPARVTVTAHGELVGLILGERYAIEERMSAGGMGVVYRGRHTVLDSPVAVKILRKPQDTEAQRRFLQEAKLASLIRHPNTVYISDFGVLTDGRSYLVMEFLSGPTLGKILQRGRLSVSRACSIALQIAQGLEAVHARGIIHRDLKPENIFVLRSDGGSSSGGAGKEYVKIVDFGIAVAAQAGPRLAGSPEKSKLSTSGDGEVMAGDLSARLTMPGTILGTPHYMSPEQADESPVDGRSDQYALGCILYEMLTGKVPFDHPSNPMQILMQHVGTPAESLRKRAADAEIPESVDAIVLRMLAKKPEERFASMTEVVTVLSRELTTLQPDDSLAAPASSASLPGINPTLQSRLSTQVVLKPQRWQLMAVAALALLFVAGSGYLGYRQWQLGHRDRPRSVAAQVVRELRQRSTAILGEDLRSEAREVKLGALLALGRAQDVEARTLIEPLLMAGDPALAAQAAEALGQLGDRQALPALNAALDKSPNLGKNARAAIADALDLLNDERGQKLLLEMLDGADEEARFRAAYILCKKGNRQAVAVLSGLLERGRPPDDVLLDALGRLAQAGEESARQQLLSRLSGAGSRARQLPIAFRLAQLGDSRGLGVLRDLAEHPGSEQLLAARLLTAVEHPDVAALFRRVLADPQASAASQVTASEGLGLSGELPDLLLLRPRLDAKPASPKASDENLRQAAAAAVLQLAASDPSVLSENGLSWARGAMTDSNWLVRESAATVLGDLPTDQATQLLGQLSKDSDVRVRRGAIRSLGKKPGRSSLLALREALYDREGLVRSEALKAILRVGKVLQKGGAQALSGELSGWFKDILQTGPPSEQVLARSVLRKLGDASQEAALASFRAATDRDVRKLLLEQEEGDANQLAAALGDSDSGVRFTAARRLGERGDARAIPLLRETLTHGGTDAIVAFGLLRRLGQAAEPPPDIEKGLFSPSPEARLLAVESFGKLPAELAVPLLLEAARDPERLVRRLTAEVAADLPAKLSEGEPPPGLPVLRLLERDGDAGVRFRVQSLLSRFGDLTRFTTVRKPEPPPMPLHRPPIEPPPPAASPPDAGTSAAPDLAPPAPIAPPPPPSESPPAPPPSSAAEAQFQAIEKTANAGLSAFEKRDYSKALRLLGKAAADCEKKRKLAQSCAALSSEMYVRLGDIYEKQDQIVEAAGEYQSALRVDPDKRARPELRAAAEKGLAKLERQLGRIIVPKTDNKGKCREVTQWVLPGNQIVSKDGQSQMVKVRAGEIINLGGCP